MLLECVLCEFKSTGFPVSGQNCLNGQKTCLGRTEDTAVWTMVDSRLSGCVFVIYEWAPRHVCPLGVSWSFMVTVINFQPCAICRTVKFLCILAVNGVST
ncbi:hypothetical protein AVEN_216767-1 [Araneus ventricosus]|uniref:Uncharacterized protein n=1 Tax=Araneus ventricosus TaxID=182803 RepID=A0A4Y2MI74_ARAVE|nr:hypothetical protein AVEN_216767-1 [Araneus ventricosus]